jgi:spermidine synthase
MFAAGLGHEFPAMLAIVTAFMGGMALGSALIDRHIPCDSRSGSWLAALEVIMGFWGIVSSFLTPDVNDLALLLIGVAPGAFKHWSVAFVIPVLALLPATMAMGASFPSMEKFASAVAPRGSSVGSIYAANTFGAVAGTMLAPFALMPLLGLSASCRTLAAINLLTGIGVWVVTRSAQTQRDLNARQERELRITTVTGTISLRRITLTLLITGLLGIGYETAGVRVLSQVLKNTVFTYAAVIAVFLLGTGAGATAYHRWWRHLDPRRLLATLLCGTAASCFAGILLMAPASHLFSTARQLGDSTFAVLAAELLTAAAAFALPTFCMGAMFSHLVQLARIRGGIGAVVAWNTIAAALAPTVCGVILLPLIGAKWTLISISAGYLLLLPGLPPFRMAIPCIIAAAFALLNPLRIISTPAGGRVIEYREGVMAAVAVIEEQNHRTLRVDNSFQMGGTASADAEYRQAHIPLLLHPNPKRALFLGLGTGISFGAASLHSDLEADGVELVPEVVDAMKHFAPENYSPQRQPQLRIHVADARRFVRTTADRYDVIIADVFHPYRDGAGALYTQEHFAAVRARLNTGGLFCQWLPLHQLDTDTLRVIVRTFHAGFPSAEAWLLRFNVDIPVVALVGGRELAWRTNKVEMLLTDATLAAHLKRLALADSLRLYGHLLADPEDLRAFAGSARLNTDDNQRVTFTAPRAAYERTAKPYDSLIALMSISKNRLAATSGEFDVRLSRYITARNAYLRALIDDAENRHEKAMAGYLESARLSGDFTTGYAQCLAIANSIANSDPAQAKKILQQLVEAQPERRVAQEMLQRLFPQ